MDWVLIFAYVFLVGKIIGVGIHIAGPDEAKTTIGRVLANVLMVVFWWFIIQRLT